MGLYLTRAVCGSGMHLLHIYMFVKIGAPQGRATEPLVVCPLLAFESFVV